LRCKSETNFQIPLPALTQPKSNLPKFRSDCPSFLHTNRRSLCLAARWISSRNLLRLRVKLRKSWLKMSKNLEMMPKKRLSSAPNSLSQSLTLRNKLLSWLSRTNVYPTGWTTQKRCRAESLVVERRLTLNSFFTSARGSRARSSAPYATTETKKLCSRACTCSATNASIRT
jgi:hypothetical protein